MIVTGSIEADQRRHTPIPACRDRVGASPWGTFGNDDKIYTNIKKDKQKELMR